MSDQNGGQTLCLFSGGKDSSWAFHLAKTEGYLVDRLLTVHPPADAYLYHVPAIHLTNIAAKSIGLPLTTVDATALSIAGTDSTEHGDRELEPLQETLVDLAADRPINDIVVGAVESRFQRDRIAKLCTALDAQLVAPLWQQDPESMLKDMVDGGLEIVIIQVSAQGLGEEWLGRTIDSSTISELMELHHRTGIHPLGEGGEYETLVIDGPHMSIPIGFDAKAVWTGNRGHLRITNAWLDE